LVACLWGGPAGAAGVDGEWPWQPVGSTREALCSQLRWFPLTIKDGDISGTLSHRRGTLRIRGRVDSLGNATLLAEAQGFVGRAHGVFRDDNASGRITVSGPDGSCDMAWTARRLR
jgi:hypothetical protein